MHLKSFLTIYYTLNFNERIKNYGELKRTDIVSWLLETNYDVENPTFGFWMLELNAHMSVSNIDVGFSHQSINAPLTPSCHQRHLSKDFSPKLSSLLHLSLMLYVIVPKLLEAWILEFIIKRHGLKTIYIKLNVVPS